MNSHTLMLLAFGWLVSLPSLSSAQVVNVPEGDGLPVMTDGLLHPDEWRDAHRIPLGRTAVLFVKEHLGHVFLGVDCGNLGKPFTVNLFFELPEGRILQLHTSAQIGERILIPGSEEDPNWTWGNSESWYANEVRWDQPQAQSLMEEGQSRTEAQTASLFPYEGFEFQILRTKLPSNEWKMRIEIQHSPDYDNPLVFPEGADRMRTDGWLRLSLNSQ